MSGKYLAFGLVVDSPIELPEAFLAEAGTATDINVRYGKVGEELSKNESFNKAREARLWWRTVFDDKHTFFTCECGLFDIRNGDEITIQPYPDADVEHIRVFLLGLAMGAIQAQRGHIPINGGAVITRNGAMIITGGKGSGKSTMNGAFIHNGYKYMSDDLSSIRIANETADVIPAYPQRKLTRDTHVSSGFDLNDLTSQDVEHKIITISDHDNWRREPTKLWAIVELYPLNKEDSVSVMLAEGHDKLSCVTRNLYNPWMYLPNGAMRPEVLKKILTIASQAGIYRVGAPQNIDNIADLARDIALALEI